MNDDELARLEHENLVAAFTAIVAGITGALVTHGGGISVLASGLPVSLFNRVLVTDVDAAPGAVAAAVGVMRDRGAPWTVTVRDGVDAGIGMALAELGLVPDEDPSAPGMAMHPIAVAGSGPAGRASAHDIRDVRGGAGFADHLAVLVGGFGMPAELVARVMNPELAKADDVRLYVGYLDGRAVSCGAGIRTGRTIGVYNIATVPQARRRGFGAEMTDRVAADGLAAGCDTAILQASAMGQPIYERLGYRTVVRYREWMDPS